MRVFLGVVAILGLFAGSATAVDLQGRVLKVGTDATYPPMETVDETTGEIVGFDVDLLNAVCEEINCRPEFVTTAWDGIFAALQQGEFDLVISGVSITEERDKVMDFSDPYLIVNQAIMFRADGQSGSAQDYDLSDKKLAAQIGTTNADMAEELVGRESVSLYDTFAAAILALQNGDVDGVVLDGTSAFAYEQEFAGDLIVGLKGLKSDPLGIVFQEGDPLVDAINAGLAVVHASGKHAALVSEYWGNPDWALSLRFTDAYENAP